jgi:hypothetical protein
MSIGLMVVCRAALWAAARLVGETAAGVELLLAGGEEEGLAAIAALERHIGGQDQDLSCE